LAIPDLAVQATGLLSLPTATEERALHQLADLAVGQVPGCAAASVLVWRDGEIATEASSHPDATWLTHQQLESGRGPLLAALTDRTAVYCADTLTEARWPEYGTAAVRLGVRCSVTLCGGDQVTVALALLAARPRAIAAEQMQMAELLAGFSAALVGAVSDYRDSQRTTVQLRDAADGRAVVDQAKGILMHALNCSAEEALARIRDVSQRSNLRATEVAARIIDAHGGQAAAFDQLTPSRAAGRQAARRPRPK
jgi:hypothetical protein